MPTWSADTLNEIALADDLHITVLHPDMATTGTLTWIWSVVTGGRLFVRSYSGRDGKWYSAALAQKAGRIQTIGRTFDVEFTPVTDETLNEQIDAAYENKYGDSPYMPAMISAGPRAATMEVTPRAPEEAP